MTPETLDVKLLSEPLMNVVSGETGSAGTGEGEAGDDDSEEVQASIVVLGAVYGKEILK